MCLVSTVKLAHTHLEQFSVLAHFEEGASFLTWKQYDSLSRAKLHTSETLRKDDWGSWKLDFFPILASGLVDL